MSDNPGSARTQQFPRIRDDASTTQELPRITTTPTGPDSAPLPTHGWTRPPPTANRGRFVEKIRNAPVWVAPAALLACFAGAATLVVATDPTDNVASTTCAFKYVTGFACPGCGGTRAFFYLLHGNVPEAATNHVIALFAAPFLVWLYLTWAGRRIFPKLRSRIPVFRITATHATWFLVAWSAFWVVRNIPFTPFTALYVLWVFGA